LQQPRRRLARKPQEPASPLTAEQRLLVLDAWQRSGLPARNFAPLVGMSRHTLYAWKKKFDTEGPAGLMNKPRGGPQGSRLAELVKRAILVLKQVQPRMGRYGQRPRQGWRHSVCRAVFAIPPVCLSPLILARPANL